MAKKGEVFDYTIMILCFIYSGISLLLFIYQLYMWIERGMFQPPFNATENHAFNETIQRGVRNFRWTPRDTPMILIVSLMGTIISSFAGFTIMKLIKKKEKKEITSKVMDSMLMPEEKLIIKLLEENNDELTQSELVKKSKLSKLKVSRVIKRLESLNVVSKYPYGVTNKIKLERKNYEEGQN